MIPFTRSAQHGHNDHQDPRDRQGHTQGPAGCMAMPRSAPPPRRLAALVRAAATASAMVILTGCSLMIPPTRVPMDSVRQPGPCATAAPVLLVMLPGAYSRPREFIDEGFIEAVRSRGLAVDIVVADAHLGYYQDRSVLNRLREDIILPARAQGYRQIWLVGISVGGFGALGYAARQISAIDGIVALAPYLGEKPVLQDIAAAGGPAAWRQLPRPNKEDDLERDVWQWLSTPDNPMPVYLGYGRSDRFIEAHRMLATVLPSDRSTDAPGGHDWPAWRALWAQWLDRGLLPSACTPGG